MFDEAEERRKLADSNYPYYVTMTDKFLSGWGMAEGRICKCIMGANDAAEARTISANARARGDQKDIKIMRTKPDYPIEKYCVDWMDRDKSANWLKPGFFVGHDKTYSRFAD